MNTNGGRELVCKSSLVETSERNVPLIPEGYQLLRMIDTVQPEAANAPQEGRSQPRVCAACLGWSRDALSSKVGCGEKVGCGDQNPWWTERRGGPWSV